MGSAVIEVSELRKSFGAVRAVDGLSFEVTPGRVLGLLGPNGAGKSTTIRMLSTLEQPDSGTARIAGFDVVARPQRARACLGLAGQASTVDLKLTGRENLRLFAWLHHLPRRVSARRRDDLVDRFSMGDYIDRPVETYSGGERRRLDLAVSIIAEPPVVFLDEPTAGLDPASRRTIRREIEQVSEAGAAVLLTTQDMDEADLLADEIVVIDRGQEVGRGSPSELKDALKRVTVAVTFDTHEDRATARSALAGMATIAVGDRSLQIRTETRREAFEALATLARAGIDVQDFDVHKPTLDDAYLALTGHPPAHDEGRPPR